MVESIPRHHCLCLNLGARFCFVADASDFSYDMSDARSGNILLGILSFSRVIALAVAEKMHYRSYLHGKTFEHASFTS